MIFEPLLLLLLVSLLEAKCPLNAVESQVYRTCITVGESAFSTEASQSYCRWLGGDLVSIHSDAQNDEVVKYLTIANSTWMTGIAWNNWGATIGLVQIPDSFFGGMTYGWTDGSRVDYTHFGASGVPFGASTSVLMVNSQGGPAGTWVYEGPWMEGSPICMVPDCSSANRKSLQPLDLINRTEYGMFYGSIAKKFYYTSSLTYNYGTDSICASMGGHLPSFTNAFEQNEYLAYVNNQSAIKAPNMLLGLNCDKNNGNCIWSDGRPVTYTNWDKNNGEPKLYTGSGTPLYTIDKKSGLWRTFPDKYGTATWYFQTCSFPLQSTVCQ